jgi:hypothetical protein
LWGVCRGSTIGGVVISVVGRLTMLHWKPRLVAVAATLGLLVIALGGAWLEDLYNLYW